MADYEFEGFKPRPRQREVLKYKKGRMGVAAVPGSGKTRTLSALAATLVARGLPDKPDDSSVEEPEVLVVTMVNAAADHFSRQVAAFVKERGLLPNFGYRVRTLHGLANDIVRERAGLVGLDRDFKIVDERESDDILERAVDVWLEDNPDVGRDYINPDYDAYKTDQVLGKQWRNEVKTVANAFIKQAKDEQLEPEGLQKHLDAARDPLPLAAMGTAIYRHYQRSLNYRGAVDFQDLIWLALRALNADQDYLARLRARWPFILEDEAQDSSQLQQRILETLSGKRGNWVRVGDPNQAIYETFTTARPENLRAFINHAHVKGRDLPNSGRSQPSIIKLANYLIDWTLTAHPVGAVREQEPLHPPYIEPTPDGDPQPNPPDAPEDIHLYDRKLTSEEEIDLIIRSLQQWLEANPEGTVAVLVPRNERGARYVKELKKVGLPVVELLRSSSSTRETAGALTHVLHALSNPEGAGYLAGAYRVWRRDDRDDETSSDRMERVASTLAACPRVEDYLHPRAGNDWMESEAVARLLETFTDDADADAVREQLLTFRALLRRWQAAVVLPIDQLLLTLAGDLFHTAADLAIVHSLALYLRRTAESRSDWRLPDYAGELAQVARNKRRVPDITQDGDAHDPDQHKGKVTVATMHAAKGLEWDRVYLTSVNNYDFPSAEPQDQFIGEAWWARDGLNLQAEALAQLRALAGGKKAPPYVEGSASQVERVEYAAERLRLLYVGITRARRELILTWNSGRRGNAYQATPFIALRNWWNGVKPDAPAAARAHPNGRGSTGG